MNKRDNAIKRVATNIGKKYNGYIDYNTYKGFTDSYHAFLIKQDVMPIDIGNDYPDLTRYFENIDKTEEYLFNIKDFKEYAKEHKKKHDLYKIGNTNYQVRYIKNVIDILGTNFSVYYQGEFKPLYFINNDNEMALILPIKVY